MRLIRAREAPAALLLLFGCAGSGEAARRDVDALRAEVRALRSDNEELSRKMDALSGRVEVISARLARAPAAQPATAPQEPEKAPMIPRDLAVVKVEPSPAHAASRPPRTAPPVPTAVPIAEPDPERIESLSRRGRDIGAEADGELRRARRKAGVERAHALEEFATRYPRHASADNALVEAAQAYADASQVDAACTLARRASDDYPAGDALSDALERLAWCESRRGATAAERRLLERLVSEFPRTPAAERAGTRLATISGRAGESPEGPARSGP